MTDQQWEPISVRLKDHQEMTTCPACGYNDGFHVALVRMDDEDNQKKFRLDLLCPQCRTRYEIGKVI